MVHSHMKRHIQSPPDTFQTPYRHPTDTLQTPSIHLVDLRLNVCVNSIKSVTKWNHWLRYLRHEFHFHVVWSINPCRIHSINQKGLSIEHKCLSHSDRIGYMGWNAPLFRITEEWLFEQRILLNFPPLRRREIYVPKKEEIWRKKRRCSHVGNCAESTENPPSPPRTTTPPCLLVICRHLWFRSPITHHRINWQLPSQHIASRLACHMRPCVLIEKAWWKLMKQNVWRHYIWKQFVWYSSLTDYMNMCWLPQSMSQCM